MRYLIILFVILTSCKKLITDDLWPPPPGPPPYHYPLTSIEIQRITSIIGNKRYVVKSIIDKATGKPADSLYPGYLNSIYTIPAKRVDSINITNKSTSFSFEGWNVGTDGATPDESRVTGFNFPIYERLRGRYAMKYFYIHLYNGPEYKINGDSGAIILTDRYPFDTCTITLLPEKIN